MDAHVRIGNNQTCTLKQAVVLYQEGNRAVATLHDVKSRADGRAYLCAGQSATSGFLQTLGKGLGACPGWSSVIRYSAVQTSASLALV